MGGSVSLIDGHIDEDASKVTNKSLDCNSKAVRLIDANSLKEEILKEGYDDVTVNKLLYLIDQLPTIMYSKVQKKQPVSIKADEDIKLGAVTWKKGVPVYKCPRCGSFISRSNNFCNKCGQAIGWEEGSCNK